jgi:hypothetical protein
MRASLSVASLFLFIALSACAALYTPRQPMPIDEVVRLSKSNTLPQEIIARIRSAGTAYALRGSDFAKLKAAGVPDPVLDYLQQSFVDDMDLLTRYWVLGENLGGCRFCYPQPVDVDTMRSGYDIPGAPSPTRYQLNKPAGTPDWVPVPLAPSHQRLSVERVVELARSGTPQSDLVNQIVHSRMDHVIGVGGIGTIRTRPAAGLDGSRLAHLRDEGLSDPVLDALQAQFLGQFIEAERLRYQNWGKGPGSNR